MDLLQHRKALSGAGLAIGFGLLVAWMVPPTEPRPMAANWRANIKPVAPPSPADFIGFAPAMAAMPAYPVEQTAYAGDGQDVVVHRGSSTETADPPVERSDMAEPPPNQVMPGHGDGFAWGDRRAAAGADICNAAPNPAVESRCRDYFESRRHEMASNDRPDDAGQEDQGDY